MGSRNLIGFHSGSRHIVRRSVMLSPASRKLALVLGILFSFIGRPFPAAGSPQMSSNEPRFQGLSLQLRAVGTSEWSELYPGTTDSFRQAPAYGLGMEIAYALGSHVAPFVAADFNLQTISSGGGMGFGSANGFGTVAGGIRIRQPISHRVA